MTILHVKALRERKGISQKRLSAMANVEQGYISRLERGKQDPSLRVLLTIAAALEVTPEALFDERLASPQIKSMLAVFAGLSDFDRASVIRHATALASDRPAIRSSSADDTDADLEAMPRLDLIQAARAMRVAIRAHRDATEHELCWHHPDMWALLPDRPAGGQVLPDWPQFMRGCIRYRASLDRQLPQAPRTNREDGE